MLVSVKNSEPLVKHEILANNLTQDLVYAMHHGRIKTWKHIDLAVTVKALTGSKQLIEVLNRLGYCISYPVLENLETRAAILAYRKDSHLPSDVKSQAGEVIILAWDNFDRFMYSLINSNKDALHDTFGIGIKFKLRDETDTEVDPHSAEDRNNDTGDEYSDKERLRIRAFKEGVTTEFPDLTYALHYNKKIFHKPSLICEQKLRDLRLLDKAWVACHYLKIPQTPMYVGFNSQILLDSSQIGEVHYLRPIAGSPTSHAVVAETLNASLHILNQLEHQKYIEVTYDLNIANIAFKIQYSEPDNIYKPIFIHLDTMHLQMALFHAIGSFIEDSGITNVMEDAGLIAPGSIKGFIIGKHFKRCQRLHTIVSCVLGSLLFDRFQSDENLSLTDEMKSSLELFLTSKSENPKVEDPSLAQILNKFIDFEIQVYEGKLGKTAQFYATYIC